MATAKELRSLSIEELEGLIAKTRDEIFRQRVKHQTGTLESTADMSKKRHDLARILTVLSEKKSANG